MLRSRQLFNIQLQRLELKARGDRAGRSARKTPTQSPGYPRKRQRQVNSGSSIATSVGAPIRGFSENSQFGCGNPAERRSGRLGVCHRGGGRGGRDSASRWLGSRECWNHLMVWNGLNVKKSRYAAVLVRNENGFLPWATNVLTGQNVEQMLPGSLGHLLEVAPPRRRSNAPFPRSGRRPSGARDSNPSRPFSHDSIHKRVYRGVPTPPTISFAQPPAVEHVYRGVQLRRIPAPRSASCQRIPLFCTYPGAASTTNAGKICPRSCRVADQATKPDQL